MPALLAFEQENPRFMHTLSTGMLLNMLKPNLMAIIGASMQLQHLEEVKQSKK